MGPVLMYAYQVCNLLELKWPLALPRYTGIHESPNSVRGSEETPGASVSL